MSNKQFLIASAALQNGKLSLSDDLKIKLYGLSKQAREGDCSTLLPQRFICILLLCYRVFIA
jgi:hypothetical protein